MSVWSTFKRLDLSRRLPKVGSIQASGGQRRWSPWTSGFSWLPVVGLCLFFSFCFQVLPSFLSPLVFVWRPHDFPGCPLGFPAALTLFGFHT